MLARGMKEIIENVRHKLRSNAGLQFRGNTKKKKKNEINVTESSFIPGIS